MVSPTPEFAVQITGADFGVIGEGEIILHQLVTALRSGRDPAAVKGLIIRDGDKVFSTGPGEFIEDLSTLPPIPYEMFPEEKWLPIGRWYAENCPQPHWRYEDRVINIHGGRGCPFECNFCYHHSRPRYRPIEQMITEGAEALERFNGNMLYFSDDLVLASPKRAREMVNAIRTLNRPIEYSISARFDILARMDDALLQEMKDTGCRIMGLGIESGSDRILSIIGKKFTAQMVLEGLERLKRVGILPTVSIQVGQYTETREDAEASLELMRTSVRSNPNINYAFTLTTPFPGSQLYDLIFEKGLLQNHQEFYDLYFATRQEFKLVVNLSAMRTEEVWAMQQKMNRVYKEEKAKSPNRKIINLKTDIRDFRRQYETPFYIDRIMLDPGHTLLVRCVSKMPFNTKDVQQVAAEFVQNDIAGYIRGQLLMDLISFAVETFPDIYDRYAAQSNFNISAYSRPDFPHMSCENGNVCRWFSIRGVSSPVVESVVHDSKCMLKSQF
jgi:radical SAM superfamily enzyme YgiQ (UPF0313 family)